MRGKLERVETDRALINLNQTCPTVLLGASVHTLDVTEELIALHFNVVEQAQAVLLQTIQAISQTSRSATASTFVISNQASPAAYRHQTMAVQWMVGKSASLPVLLHITHSVRKKSQTPRSEADRPFSSFATFTQSDSICLIHHSSAAENGP